MQPRSHIFVPLILLALFAVAMFLPRAEPGKQPDPVPSPAAAPIVPTSPPPAAQKPKDALPRPEPYTFATPSADGIGKIFMGREISHVMGHPGIGWLERTDREKEEAPSKAIALLGLTPDMVIADIGAGSGYYAFRLAGILPQGRVVAVDIQQEMLDYLKEEAARRNITNLQPHLGAVDDIKVDAETLDAVLMVDAYHEFSHPVEMLQSIRKALKPGGKIYLLEFRAEDPKVPIKALHKMSKDQAVKEFQAIGFEFVESKPELPWQHLLIFRKPGK